LFQCMISVGSLTSRTIVSQLELIEVIHYKCTLIIKKEKPCGSVKTGYHNWPICLKMQNTITFLYSWPLNIETSPPLWPPILRPWQLMSV